MMGYFSNLKNSSNTYTFAKLYSQSTHVDINAENDRTHIFKIEDGVAQASVINPTLHNFYQIFRSLTIFYLTHESYFHLAIP